MKVRDTIVAPLTSSQTYFNQSLRFLKTPQKVSTNLVSGIGSSFSRKRDPIDFDLRVKLAKEADESTSSVVVTKDPLS
jgi:hypothetical protein